MTFYNYIENARYRCIEKFNCQDKAYVSENLDQARHEYDKLKAENDKLRERIAELDELLPENGRWFSFETVNAYVVENRKLRKLCEDLRFCKRNNCLTCSHGRFCDMHFDERYDELGIEVKS